MSILDIERRIAGEVISEALAAGHTIDVCDGVETTVRKSCSKRAVLAAMFSTDRDILTVRTGPGGRLGTILFIWGNGADVLTDWSDRPEINAILRRALDIGNRAR
jgi:hypothetical protein